MTTIVSTDPVDIAARLYELELRVAEQDQKIRDLETALARLRGQFQDLKRALLVPRRRGTEAKPRVS